VKVLLIVLLIAVIVLIGWFVVRSRPDTAGELPTDDRPDAIGPGTPDDTVIAPPPADIAEPAAMESSPLPPPVPEPVEEPDPWVQSVPPPPPEPLEQPAPPPEPAVVPETAPPMQPDPIVEPLPEPDPITEPEPPVEPEPVIEPDPEPIEPEPVIEPHSEPVEPDPVIEPDTAGVGSTFDAASDAAPDPGPGPSVESDAEPGHLQEPDTTAVGAPHGDPLATEAGNGQPYAPDDSERSIGEESEKPAEDLDPHAGWESEDDTRVHADPESGLYHTPDSPGYKLGPDGQIFESEDDAREAGFTRWDQPS